MNTLIILFIFLIYIKISILLNNYFSLIKKNNLGLQ